jgi:hypothetical protein
MIKNRRTAIVGLAALLGLTAVSSVQGQSVFPVSFGEPTPEGPATLQSSGPLVINEGTYYRRTGSLVVTPGVQEAVLQVTASQDDTTAWLRIFLAAVQNDTTGPSTVREEFKLAIYDAPTNSWAGLQENFSLNLIGGGVIDVDFVVSGADMTVRFTPPGSLDQVLFKFEVITSRQVTFTELF